MYISKLTGKTITGYVIFKFIMIMAGKFVSSFKKLGLVSLDVFSKGSNLRKFILSLVIASLAACSAPSYYDVYHNPAMDFDTVKTVAIMPFENLTDDKSAAERVRDVFTNIFLSTGQIYVIPTGEVRRGSLRAGITDLPTPSAEEIIKFASITKVNVVITGVVREYGQVRSGPTSANIISFSLQMIEAQSGKIIWTASSTKGGISTLDRLFGGGGKPMNDITEEAVNEIINKYF